MTRRLRVASRMSPLARAQAAEFQVLFPDVSLDMVWLDSPGDRERTTSLLDGGAPGDFFTRDLDLAILEDRADAALHSAKDLPWPLPKGLGVWCLGPRAEAGDALVSRQGWTLATLPPGARVGTSSPARRAALIAARPDLTIVSIRGTIHERIALLDQKTGPNGEPRPDAVVVAACALRRLGLPPGSPLPFPTHHLQGHLALTGLHPAPREAAWFSGGDVRRHWGRVSILGAGPGRADLLTLAARERLNHAEVIFHDALLDQGMLQGLGADLVFAGKRQGRHAMGQDGINEALRQEALKGRRVVRLKGGDPLVLGRGSEEAAYLGSHLVPYEIIPGISAAQTAAAFAEVPLTERGRASSTALVSGWPAERLRWTGADTQAFYMAGSALERIATAAVDAGRGSEGLAAVQGAGSPWQSCTVLPVARAAELPALTPDDRNDAPILYLSGPTVDSRAGNGWWDRLPRVLHTGLEAPSDLAAWSERVVHIPFVKIEELRADEAGRTSPWFLGRGTGSGGHLPVMAKGPGIGHAQQDERAGEGPTWLDGTAPWDWVVFTSRQTVRIWFRLWADRGLDARAFGTTRIAAIGPTTAAALGDHGVRADLVPPGGQDHSRGLATALEGLGTADLSGTHTGSPHVAGDTSTGHSPMTGHPPGPTCLIPRSNRALPLLPDLLGAGGWRVDTATLYRTVALAADAGPLDRYHHLVLASPSAVAGLAASYPALPTELVVRCRGPQTREAFVRTWPHHPDAKETP